MAIPTITNLKTQISSDWVFAIQKVFPTFQPNLQKINVLTGISLAIAPTIRQTYQFAIQAAKQGNPLDADSKTVNAELGSLESWGDVFLDRPPSISSQGQYAIEFTGTGGTLLAGTILVNQATQEEYTVNSNTIVNGTVDVIVTSSNFGEQGKLFVNDELVTTQVFTGADSVGTCVSVIQDPSNAEETEEYRQAILAKTPIVPRGGSIGDYVLYADEINGVLTAYPYNGDVLGNGVVYIRANTSTRLDEQGTPPQSLIDSVRANTIEKANLIAPNVEFKAIRRREYTATIENLSDNTKKTTIEQIIKDYFATKEPFIDGVSRQEELYKDNILSAEIFSNVIIGIAPTRVTDITLNVRNEVVNGYTQTPDIKPNTNNLFGISSPVSGGFAISKDGGALININIQAQSITNLGDYVSSISQSTLLIGVRTLLITAENDQYIKFESDSTYTVSQPSSIFITTPTTTGLTDITGNNYLDISNGTQESGGTVTNPEIKSEVLPQGTIGYLKEIKYVTT